MFKKNQSLLAVAICLAISTIACNSSKAVTNPETPTELGEAITSVRNQVIQDMKSALEGYPDAPKVKAELQKIKDDAIPKLVEYGKVHNKMSPEKKKQTEDLVKAGYAKVAPDVYKFLNDAGWHYRPTDNDLANMISELQIVTQYAFYDLLKKQRPQEATRLGIE